jgi:hypothetical protein
MFINRTSAIHAIEIQLKLSKQTPGIGYAHSHHGRGEYYAGFLL